MSRYRTRLARDLDGWIAAGLVPATSRDAILTSIAPGRRLDAATALAVVGALLAGVAVIAFTGANWDLIPRFFRFAILLAAFLAAAGAGAWAAKDGKRPIAGNLLLMVAALIYAAAIGLTGQIFDITGDPRQALHGAALAAGVLALAGRSSGAAAAGLALAGLGDFEGQGAGWLLPAAVLGAALAWRWDSRPLAHAAGLAALAGGFTLVARDTAVSWLLLALLFGGAAIAARWRAQGVLYGWLAAAALAYFAAAGFEGALFPALAHRLALLALSAAAVALGRHDRQPGVTLAGVVGLAVAVWAVLQDLGLGLMTAAGLFAVCAVLALGGGWLLRERRAR